MTTAELIIRFPEFTAESTARLQLAIDDAELIVGLCFGKFRPLAVSYLAAHLFVVGKQSASGDILAIKEIASESVGSVSASYLASSDTINAYGSTTYGQQFETLRKRSCSGSVLIG